MKYPKPIMRMKELTKMGFPEKFLLEAYRTMGQTFAQKIDPLATNSPIIFDTEEFEKWRMAKLKSENRALPRG